MTVVDTYDKAAAQWDRKLDRMGYTAAYAGFFEDRVTARGPVLDVGTGTGAFAQAWVSAGGSTDLTLLDTSQPMLNGCAARFAAQGLSPRLARTCFMTFKPDAPFQTILAAHVIEHFDDPRQGIARLAHMLVPGGRLLLAVSKPHWCNWLIWLKFRHRWYSSSAMREMAAQAGLQTELCTGFNAGPPGRTSLGYIFQKPTPPI